MNAPENPAAFPLHTPDGPRYHQNVEPGMTLRDWFAGQALAGMMSRPRWAGEPLHTFGAEAIDAYKQADAMLVERERAK